MRTADTTRTTSDSSSTIIYSEGGNPVFAGGWDVAFTSEFGLSVVDSYVRDLVFASGWDAAIASESGSAAQPCGNWWGCLMRLIRRIFRGPGKK